MEPSERRWKELLALYGSDFRHWPEKIPQDLQDRIMHSVEFADARTVDNALKEMPWPSPSDGLRTRTLDDIRRRGAAATAMAQPVLIFLLRRPVILFSLLALVVGLGFTSGAQLSKVAQQQVAYGFFSVGPTYGYSAAMDGRHD